MIACKHFNLFHFSKYYIYLNMYVHMITQQLFRKKINIFTLALSKSFGFITLPCKNVTDVKFFLNSDSKSKLGSKLIYNFNFIFDSLLHSILIKVYYKKENYLQKIRNYRRKS
jgi:hypothetical protein